MICPSCKRPLAPGVRSCPRCAKATAPRPVAKPAAVPASDELLPDEPALPPSAAGRAAAEAAAVPIRPRRQAPLRSGGGKAKATIGGVLMTLLVVAGLGLKVCRVSRGILGETIENKMVTIGPEGEHSGLIEVTGSHDYTFTVASVDGSVHMAVTRVANKSPGEKEILKLLTGAVEVTQGHSKTLTGRFSSGYYLWAVLNVSEKAVKARISFSAR